MQALTDVRWAKFEAAIASVGLRGARPRKEERRTIEAIIWRLENGAKWRSIPAELGHWHHGYLRFRLAPSQLLLKRLPNAPAWALADMACDANESERQHRRAAGTLPGLVALERVANHCHRHDKTAISHAAGIAIAATLRLEQYSNVNRP
jgi:transposase